MAKIVEEIMNAELFALRPSDRTEDAVKYLVALGITAAPVLDERRSPVAVVTLRDMLAPHAPQIVAELMTVPAITLSTNETIDEAARLMAELGLHHIVVVDDAARAVGIVSSIDVIRGLIGVPAAHPASFPHYDRRHDVCWTDDVPLDASRIEAAPAGPGVFGLVSGGRGMRERLVWAEATSNVRARLFELLTCSEDRNPELASIFADCCSLRFRAARVDEPDKQRAIAASMLVDAHKHAETLVLA